MPAEGYAEEKVQGVGGTVAGWCRTCPHRVPQSHTMPGIRKLENKFCQLSVNIQFLMNYQNYGFFSQTFH